MEKGFFKNLKFQNLVPPMDNTQKERYDIGFGFKFSNKRRLVNDDGSFNITKTGKGSLHLYEWLVEMSWTKFFLLLVVMYIVVNSIFGLLFMWAGIDTLEGIRSGPWYYEFGQCFFFSIQTFTTVGYGIVGPIGFWANLLAASNAFLGLLAFALATGLFFARFSKARSSIKFSKNVILTPFGNEFKSIQLRIINTSNVKMTDMQARMLLTWLDEEKGKYKRKFERLELFIDSIYLFPLNWTIVHVIDKDSPLFNKSIEWLKDHFAELIIIVKGFDDNYSQFITDYRGYDLAEVKENYKFETMYQVSERNTALNLDKLDDLEKI